MAIVQLIKYDDLPASKISSNISLINNNNGTLTINSTYIGGAKNTYSICTKKLVGGHKYCIISIPKYTRDSTHHIEFQVDYGDSRRYDENGNGLLFIEDSAGDGQEVSCTLNLLLYAWNGSFDIIPQIFDLTESGIIVDSVDEFKSNYLSYFLSDIATAIKIKRGISDNINAQDFSTEIDKISTGVVPSGKINITNTNETDVTDYATAQVVDNNLVANNIKSGTTILGITGTYEGSGGDNTLKALLDYTKSCAYMFQGNSTITDLTPYFSYDTTSNVTNMEYMFSNCSNLTSVPSLDTSKVTNMSSMFYYCSNLTTIPVLDTSKVTNMSTMFRNCPKLTTIPELNTSNVTSMTYMFYYCSNLTTIPELDTSKVTNMLYMFGNCPKLTTIPELNTSNVTDMSYMFVNDSNLTSVPSLDTSKVTNMRSMFDYCSNLKSILMHGMKVSFSISASTQFSRLDLTTILYNLDSVKSTKTLTMGSTNLAKLTNEDKAIATGKGWSLA